MEGENLVSSKEIDVSATFPTYGSVNPCCDDLKGQKEETALSSSNGKITVNPSNSKDVGKNNEMAHPRSCYCLSEKGLCECNQTKKSIVLDSWANYKTIVMAIAFILLAVWIVVIAIVASKHKL